MGTKNNPGDYDCYENADPDEPMFILLARDPIAPFVIREWVRRRESSAGSDLNPIQRGPKMQEALDCADAMEAWRESNR